MIEILGAQGNGGGDADDLRFLVKGKNFSGAEMKALSSRVFYNSSSDEFYKIYHDEKNFFDSSIESHIYDCERTITYLAGNLDF